MSKIENRLAELGLELPPVPCSSYQGRGRAQPAAKSASAVWDATVLSSAAMRMPGRSACKYWRRSNRFSVRWTESSASSKYSAWSTPSLVLPTIRR